MMFWRSVVAWLWTALILVACWTPGRHLPMNEVPSGFRHLPHVDKLVHASMFGGFGLVWMAARPSRRRWQRILLFGLLLAVLSELGQGLPIIDRDPDIWDALADGVGLMLGMGLFSIGECAGWPFFRLARHTPLPEQ